MSRTATTCSNIQISGRRAPAVALWVHPGAPEMATGGLTELSPSRRRPRERMTVPDIAAWRRVSVATVRNDRYRLRAAWPAPVGTRRIGGRGRPELEYDAAAVRALYARERPQAVKRTADYDPSGQWDRAEIVDGHVAAVRLDVAWNASACTRRSTWTQTTRSRPNSPAGGGTGATWPTGERHAPDRADATKQAPRNGEARRICVPTSLDIEDRQLAARRRAAVTSPPGDIPVEARAGWSRSETLIAKVRPGATAARVTAPRTGRVGGQRPHPGSSPYCEGNY